MLDITLKDGILSLRQHGKQLFNTIKNFMFSPDESISVSKSDVINYYQTYYHLTDEEMNTILFNANKRLNKIF